MTRARLSISGTALETAERIIAQTKITTLSELFALLLQRYEHDFVLAHNGFTNPSSVQLGHSVQIEPKNTHSINQNEPPQGQSVQTEPKDTRDINQDKPSLGQSVQIEPKRTLKSMMASFDD